MKTKLFFAILLTCSVIMSIEAQLKKINYTDNKQELEGLAGIPKKSTIKKAGVLILPAWMGIDTHSKESAEALTKLGYYTFVADIYGIDKRPNNSQEAGKLAGHYKTNYAAYQNRILLALTQLVNLGADPNQIAVIGYCFGGTGALEVARASIPVKGVVSFHGGLGKDDTRSISPIKTKVLVLHGADDPYVPEKEVQQFIKEMRTSKADWQMVSYANAVHSFTHKNAGNDNSKGAAYNATADKRSWKAMLTFFDEIFL